MNERAIVTVPGNEHLDHTVELTGRVQRNAEGVLYLEGQRTDNDLYEMVPESWIDMITGGPADERESGRTVLRLTVTLASGEAHTFIRHTWPAYPVQWVREQLPDGTDFTGAEFDFVSVPECR